MSARHSSRSHSSRSGVEDYTSETMATINYSMQDLGDRYSFTPSTPFRTSGSNAVVTLDSETRRLMIRPKRRPNQSLQPGQTRQIFGGYIVLPKKADANADPVVCHEGPVGQCLRVEVAKLAEFCTTPRTR